jgi:site-specific DNA-cytosine methylase
MEYKPHPTKEDLLAYFGQRIRIRKMTEIEAMRLMDVEDSDIQKVQQAGIAKTNIYKLAGNSIVVSCLYYIFRNLFTPQDMPTQTRQLSLF